jgi:amino acid transporter
MLLDLISTVAFVIVFALGILGLFQLRPHDREHRVMKWGYMIVLAAFVFSLIIKWFPLP